MPQHPTIRELQAARLRSQESGVEGTVADVRRQMTERPFATSWSASFPSGVFEDNPLVQRALDSFASDPGVRASIFRPPSRDGNYIILQVQSSTTS